MIDGLIINQQLNPALPGFTFQVIICDYKFHNHHNHEQSIIYHPQSPFTSIVLIYIAYIADLYCLYCVDLVLIYIYCADCADLYCVTIVSHLLYCFYLRLSNLRGTNIQKLPFIYIDLSFQFPFQSYICIINLKQQPFFPLKLYISHYITLSYLQV